MPRIGHSEVMNLIATAERLESDLDLTAHVHARDLASGAQVGLRCDDPVVSASVFKIPVLVEVCSQIATGQRGATDRITLEPGHFPTLGPTGYSVTSDAVSLSLRDLYLSMMTVSDNRATDVVMDLVGRERINARMLDLGLPGTVLERDCAGLFAQMRDDLRHDLRDDLRDASGKASGDTDLPGDASDEPVRDEELAALLTSDAIVRARVLDANRTNRTTPAEATALLARIWTDDGLDPAATAEMRRILGLQVWPHRLRSGFPDEVRTSGKTGTLPSVRNEVGVVEYPDGGRYAVAVFLRTASAASVFPDADRAIGTLAAAAVAELRG